MYEELDSFNSWEADASYAVQPVSNAAATDILQQTQGGVAASGDSAWTGFWQDTIKGAIGYVTAVDTAKTRQEMSAAQARAQYQSPVYRQQQSNQNLMPLLLIGGLVFLLAKD